MTRPDDESVGWYQKEHGVLETHTKTRVRTRHDLSLVYTPGVAEISRRIRDGRESAFTCTMKANTVAIVTDGSAILGMGDLGPYPAIPVMEGKALLYKEFAGIDAIPHLSRRRTDAASPAHLPDRSRVWRDRPGGYRGAPVFCPGR